jgi:benzylsuccinate CoA-transferase BbsF subunit
MSGVLEGIKVADFTWVATGPLMTRTLADYGAEVVKIEGRSSPDSMRVSGPFKDGIPGLEREGWFLVYNTNKRSVALNLANPKGIEIAKRFVAWADIVAENFAGGVMEKMGLGYEELKKVNPGIIMISASMQGQTGPHAKHRALGGQLAALSGFCHITGWPEGGPTPIGVYTDYVVPHFSVPVLLAALLYRRRTGKGQYIDLSQFESGLQFMAPILLDYTVNGREAGRMGNHCAYAAPHGAYRCRGEDRWCAISVFTEAEWQGFCEAIGNPEWSRGPEFGSLHDRKKNEDRLDALIGDWTIQRSAEEVMAALQTKGVPAGVLETDQELLERDPQLKHRRYFRQLDHPEVGKHIVHREAFTLSKSPSEMARAPLLGEHNEYALKHILGLSDDEIAELVVSGALE